MRSCTTLALALSIGLLVPTADAGAQDVDEFAAYLALIATPSGGLAPMLDGALMGRAPAGATLTPRYAYASFPGDVNLHQLAVSGDVGISPLARFGGTLGYSVPDCGDGDDCDGNFFGGVSLSSRLTSSPVGEGGAALNIGLEAGLGFAAPEDATVFSAAASLPIALATTSGNLVFAPFIAPGFGWGRFDAEDSLLGDFTESAFRAMLGGGLSVASTAGNVAFHAGLQKVFVEEGDIVFGLGLTWGLQ